jgi:hypothetical protein
MSALRTSTTNTASGMFAPSVTIGETGAIAPRPHWPN